MKIGTRSVVYGVHQLFFHPLVVTTAWVKLYRKFPRWWELIAIFLHDAPGYWAQPNIDGEEGKLHPFKGAFWASRIVGTLRGRRIDFPTYWLSLLHSRDIAKSLGREPSRLYAPDKYSVMYDPAWCYLLRARLSGELDEFKTIAINAGHLPAGATDREWYFWYRANVAARPEIRKLLKSALDCSEE